MRISAAGVVAVVVSMILSPALRAAPGDVIPRPTQVREMPGQFTITDQTTLNVDSDAADMKETAQVLVDLLAKPLGTAPQLKTGDGGANSILLTEKDADPALGNEGYQLTVAPDSVIIRAKTTAGLFYGIQTLRQLLPSEIESQNKVTGVAWTIPCVEISDSPRYAWRGLMLDVARHFYDKAEVEHVLDLMALHKQNVFHWHLTDDQGWRIEIKKYPRLTEIGAWRDGIGFGLDPKRTTHYRADGKYGGFYTQDEIREVVAYAKKLHIMVLPEIEMPGHAMAALSAYPEFATGNQKMTVGSRAGVMNGIYDPGNDQTFVFLQNVLSEVVDLFPCPFLHVGGDEVPKGPWKKAADCQAMIKKLGLKNEDQLQSYFIQRIEKFLETKNRRLIGWDEILEGGLAPGATVMSWRGVGGGIAAARQGHDVIMSPTSNAYFDYSQTKIKKGQEPTIGGYLPLRAVYMYNPTPAQLSPDQQKHILGAQGNLWTEYVPNMKQVEHQLFPRDCAMAEVAWSAHDRIDYPDFLRRLAEHEKRLKVLGVNYFVEPAPTPGSEPIGEWKPSQMSETLKPLQWDASKVVTKPGKYQVTMQYTEGACRLDIAWVALLADGNEIARDTHEGHTGGSDKNNVYQLVVPETKAAKFTLVAQVRSDGGTDSNGTVTITPVR
jgi:hexosaminidase